MPIDWFTVCAQAVNFLALVWLLKRFLYRPILRAIDEREARIAREVADTASRKAEAEQAREEYLRKNEAFERERAASEARMRSEVDAERRRLLDEARQAADAWTAQCRDALEREARSLDQAVGHRLQQQAFAIARKTLGSLASVDVEARLFEAFLERLRGLEGAARSDMTEALRTVSGPALVRSAFALSPEQHAAFERTLAETFAAGATVRYDVAPELIGGVELIANGRKVAWHLADGVQSLEAIVGELVPEPGPAEAAGKNSHG